MSEATFDRIAHRYDETLPPHVVEHYLSKRVRFLTDLCPPGRALDVGCGTGALAGRLARAGFEVTGLDPSQGMLDVMAEKEPAVRAVRGSGAEMPFEDGSFDLVVSVATLHHIADPQPVRETLAEMARVGRGGLLVVWDHNPRNPYWGRLMSRVPQDDGSERLVGAAEIEAGLAAAGAEALSVRSLGLVPDFVPRSMLGAARLAERAIEGTPLLRRLCAHNVVVARG